MNQSIQGVLILALSFSFFTPAASAATGLINKACMESGRARATAETCDCIQKVANQTLSRKHRRTAAKLFSDPHRAQEIRQSDRRSHEMFWEKYRAFGDAVAKTCG